MSNVSRSVLPEIARQCTLRQNEEHPRVSLISLTPLAILFNLLKHEDRFHAETHSVHRR